MDLDNYGKGGVGANIQTWVDNGESAQRYYIYRMCDSYYLRPACVDWAVDMDLNKLPGNVAAWDYGADWKPQKFDIERIDMGGNLPVDVGNDFYARVKNIATSWYFTNNNGNIEGQILKSGDEQLFKFERQADGSYKITSKSDGKTMDLSNYGKDGVGANIQTWVNNDSTAQRYYIYKMFGAYYLKPVCVSWAVDMDINKSPGNVAAWQYGEDWDPQKFDIIKYVKGDCNADGKFTVADAVMLQKWILAVKGAELTDWQAADLCEDGVINTFDLVMMKRLIVNKTKQKETLSPADGEGTILQRTKVCKVHDWRRR